jgi:hypothetical protein
MFSLPNLGTFAGFSHQNSTTASFGVYFWCPSLSIATKDNNKEENMKTLFAFALFLALAICTPTPPVFPDKFVSKSRFVVFDTKKEVLVQGNTISYYDYSNTRERTDDIYDLTQAPYAHDTVIIDVRTLDLSSLLSKLTLLKSAE